jgi:hypothetical protein
MEGMNQSYIFSGTDSTRFYTASFRIRQTFLRTQDPSHPANAHNSQKIAEIMKFSTVAVILLLSVFAPSTFALENALRKTAECVAHGQCAPNNGKECCEGSYCEKKVRQLLFCWRRCYKETSNAEFDFPLLTTDRMVRMEKTRARSARTKVRAAIGITNAAAIRSRWEPTNSQAA